MAKSVVPIMPICNNKYISGSKLQYTFESLCNGYFLIACVAKFLILFHPRFPNMPCVENIFARLINLALLYKSYYVD